MYEHDGYESEYQAPPYSVLDKRIVGLKVITTVIIDGEIAEFEVDRRTVVDGQQLEG